MSSWLTLGMLPGCDQCQEPVEDRVERLIAATESSTDIDDLISRSSDHVQTHNALNQLDQLNGLN